MLITLSEAGSEGVDRWKHQITGRGAGDSKTGEMCPKIKSDFHANSELFVWGLEEEGSNAVSSRETAH